MVEGGEGFVDAGDGVFVGADVEVFDCVVDELRWVMMMLVSVSCGCARAWFLKEINRAVLPSRGLLRATSWLVFVYENLDKVRELM